MAGKLKLRSDQAVVYHNTQKRAPFYDVWFLFSKRAFAVIVTL